MNFDVKKFVSGFHDYLAAELLPLVSRLKILESRKAEKGDRGEKGEPGIPGENGKPGIHGERGEKGEDGLNGKDAAPGASGPKGDRGEKGEPGLDGKDGAPGAPGMKGEPGLDGKDGAPGAPGMKGEPGLDGKDGTDGLNGKDGKSITDEDLEKAIERRSSAWQLDFERRAGDTLQRAIDKIVVPKDGIDGKDGADGVDGKDGKDGMGFDDLSIVHLDAKRLKFVFVSGSQKKEFILKMDIVVDAGVYAQGKTYSKGDGVTYGGSFWIAQVDNPNQSPGKGAEWRLAVKRGKDAREARGQ